MIEVAVTTNLECAHRSDDGVLHGHSYVIEVWFPAGRDLAKTAIMVRNLSARVDHTLLEESIGSSTMESIATWFITNAKASRVVVRRPTLGFVVEATASPSS
jgi:6-pyruvoyl-tetrahydropterin synthase